MNECNLCGSDDVEFVNHSIVYGSEIGEWPYIYLCRNCGAYVGVHKGTKKPLGTLADNETRALRKHAHTVFDSLWKNKETGMTRKQAYQWLADKFGISIKECHIGKFSKEQCERVIEVATNELARPDGCTDDHLEFLDDLRESGVTNMFGSPQYLREKFRDLDRHQAQDIVKYWMKTFGQGER